MARSSRRTTTPRRTARWPWRQATSTATATGSRHGQYLRVGPGPTQPGSRQLRREGRLRRGRRAELARPRRLRRRRLPRRGRRQPARAASQARDGAARARKRHVRLRRYFPPVFASRLTSGDLNGDGSPDLVFSDGGALAVMLTEATRPSRGHSVRARRHARGRRLQRRWAARPRGRLGERRNGAWSVTVHRNRPGLCNVQDLRGRTLAAAADLLTRPDCTVGPVAALVREPCDGAGSSRSLPLPGQRPACGRPGIARAQSQPSLSARFSTRSSGGSARRDRAPRPAAARRGSAAAAAAHGAPQLFLHRLSAPGRPLLQVRNAFSSPCASRPPPPHPPRARGSARPPGGAAGEEAARFEVPTEAAGDASPWPRRRGRPAGRRAARSARGSADRVGAADRTTRHARRRG